MSARRPGRSPPSPRPTPSVIDGLKAVTQSLGLDVQVIVKDSQSNPNRAAEVAKQLIVDDQINIMLVASTPETTNPVATTCEAEGMPCISTRRRGSPGSSASRATPATSTHGSRSTSPTISSGGWRTSSPSSPTCGRRSRPSKKVGGLFPNDGDGNAWGDKTVGFPPVLAEKGFTLNDPGRYQNLTDDFSAQINAFKSGGVEIITGVMIPPDFTTFWNQAKQQGFTPKVASIGKAILFPQAVEALGNQGNNLSSEVWWSPTHPFKSSLTGVSCAELAAGFTEATKRPWTQPIGFIHALFEVAIDVIKRVDDPTDAEAVDRGDCRDQARHHCRAYRVERGQRAALRRQEHLQDAAGRRPMAAEGRRRLRPGDHG